MLIDYCCISWFFLNILLSLIRLTIFACSFTLIGCRMLKLAIMANKNEPLSLENSDNCRAWLLSFGAHCRTKNISDSIPTNGTSEMMDAFIERCGTQPLIKIISMFPGKDIETMTFKEVKTAIEHYVSPRERLIIADRTNFLQISQNEGEPEIDFLSRINEASVHCKWDSLKAEQPSTEMIKLRFIAGLRDPSLKILILEKLQSDSSMNIDSIIDFCQMRAQVSNFADTKPKIQNEPTECETLHIKITKCSRCNTSHKPRNCPAYGKTCNICQKQGHFAVCCRQSNSNTSRLSYEQPKNNQPFHNIDIFTVNDVENEGIVKEFKINESNLRFQMDTGAAMSIMSEKQWKDIGSPALTETSMCPTNYDGTQIETLGEIICKVKKDSGELNAKFIVVKSGKDYGLIGRNIIDKNMSNIATYSIDTDALPVISGFTASIALVNENVPLKFVRARNIPLHVKEKICDELDVLEKQGVISPVQFSKHASPVVWVKKANGRYRMCVDFKATLNEHIQSDAYPLPTIEDIFGRIGNACKFAKVDLKSAYSQILLDDNARALSVINTSKGLYTVNRLQMGMKNASAIFQKCIEQVVKGLSGIVVYQDDVLVYADSDSQLHKRLAQLRKRLVQRNVTINEQKSVSCTESLTFLGFVFSKEGIKPDNSLVNKITEMPAPENAKELSSFLGMVNYYGRFIMDFAEICVPLNELRNKAAIEFHWNQKCDESFNRLKHILTTKPVLKPFSLQHDSVLTTDASGQSIGAVLSQNGHPILYVSRKLSEAERRYSNIEREGLAIVWACQRLQNFLLGKKFKIETDHKPLLFIFGSECALKTEVSQRLMKFALKMMKYDYEIHYIEGKTNVIADTLSRVNYQDNVKVPSVHFSIPTVCTESLKKETAADRFLQDLKRRIVSGEWSNLSKWECNFRRYKHLLTIDDNDLIRLGSKVVAPRSLHKQIMENAHQSHNGVQSTYTLIQREFFWPHMRQSIESFVKGCNTCQQHRLLPRDTTHTWAPETAPWTRIHIDWGYHRQVGNILVVADAFSGWIEAIVCNNRTTSTVINVLRSIFARFGVPHLLVSDNAPEFSCQEFKGWLSAIGCSLVHSPEYRPQSNGLAERSVRTIKDGLKCFNPAKSNIYSFLHRLLFVHRNTAQRSGRSPAELLIGRNVRCPIMSQYAPFQQLFYKANNSTPAAPVRYLFRQGNNTSLVTHDDDRTVLAHDAQLAPVGEQVDDVPVADHSHAPVRPRRNHVPVRRYPDVDPTVEGRCRAEQARRV